ncbi:uncharacterized protein LOC132728352 [Ruditapes philippinarum]|uniref:uncharacterized protein LOC132728352 n=1 Tax=Ruditapes philippinarum TaxID=129788 RepID=UPI00295C388A|nr:uncharacterized protein LOC132728352 [Ruditapes philippinarum]
MVHRIRVCSILIFLFLALNYLEAKRERKPKTVGKCLDKQGKLKCNSKQACVDKNKLCVPYDMSPKCKCKKLKVKGCEDMLGRSVCKNDEVCLDKKTGNPCSNKQSKNCKCTVQKETAPENSPNGPGCFVAVDLIKIFIPLDHKFHTIKQMPCKECMCMPRYPHYVDFCRPKPNCNSALHLFFDQ